MKLPSLIFIMLSISVRTQCAQPQDMSRDEDTQTVLKQKLRDTQLKHCAAQACAGISCAVASEYNNEAFCATGIAYFLHSLDISKEIQLIKQQITATEVKQKNK